MNLNACIDLLAEAAGGYIEPSSLPSHLVDAHKIGPVILRSDRWKTRLALLPVPIGDSLALLDVGKVADVALFVMDGDVVRDSDGFGSISALKAQGMLSAIGIVQGIAHLPQVRE